MTQRTCTRCKSAKAVADFRKDRRVSDGYARTCRDCDNELTRIRYARSNAKWLRARQRNRPQIILTRIKIRARKVGVPCTLTLDDVRTLLADTPVCPVLGVDLVSSVGKGTHQPDSPTLDRFIPELGYVPGNVSVISWRANVLKRDATPEELFRLAEWVMHRQEATAVDAQAASTDWQPGMSETLLSFVD